MLAMLESQLARNSGARAVCFLIEDRAQRTMTEQSNLGGSCIDQNKIAESPTPRAGMHAVEFRRCHAEGSASVNNGYVGWLPAAFRPWVWTLALRPASFSPHLASS